MQKYKMRVVRGAFVDSTVLDNLASRVIERLEGDAWISIDEVIVTLEQIKELQKQMVKHYYGQTVPWYMDGYKENDKNELLVGFGADDGEGGRIFEFKRDDAEEIKKVVEYGISKGIPNEQMDFNEIDF